jgi:hypothetical protein
LARCLLLALQLPSKLNRHVPACGKEPFAVFNGPAIQRYRKPLGSKGQNLPAEIFHCLKGRPRQQRHSESDEGWAIGLIVIRDFGDNVVCQFAVSDDVSRVHLH